MFDACVVLKNEWNEPACCFWRERKVIQFWRENHQRFFTFSCGNVMSSGSSDSGDGPSPFPTALRLSSNRPPASSDYTPPRRPTLAKNPDCCVFEVSRALSADAGTCGLVDRHTQEAKLTDFVVSHVKGGKAGVLYVCGAPGTGKTATTVCACRIVAVCLVM